MEELKELNDKQLIFATQYLLHRNGAKAAEEAGYTIKNARSMAHQLLKRPEIRAYIDEKTKGAVRDADISKEQLLIEHARIGFADVRKLFREDGTLKSIHELDDSIAAAVSSIETVRRAGNITIKKIRFYPKQASLDSLSKHLGFMEEKPQEVNVNFKSGEDPLAPVQIVINEAKQKDGDSSSDV